MMRFNIFHRPGRGENYRLFRRQQDLAHSLGLRTTVFLFYADLFEDEILSAALRDRDEHGDELGIALHGLGGPGLSEVTNGQLAIWLLDMPRKEIVLSTILGKWREVFGGSPSSVASYHFDSSSLGVLLRLAPEVRTVIGGCFEEGVRVFHGCNHSWYLFNEGMPWCPWYPSRSHTLRPAADEADSAGVVAVPHLVRDMSLAYEGRNDFWASHPPNVIRGMGNDATFCPYDLNLVDQFRLQERWNGGNSYYNTFVSPGWLDWNHNSEYPPEVSWELYEKFLRYMAGLKAEGRLEDMTLCEYGDWHRLNKPVGGREVFLAKEMLYGSGKHYFWFCDSHRRITVDATQGGSIGDLRPYAGRVPVATGSDTPHRDIGSYPYLIHSQHRSGAAHHYVDGARTTLLLTHASETLDACDMRSRVASIETAESSVRVELDPVAFLFRSGLAGQIVTTCTFVDSGVTTISRRVAGLSDPSAMLELMEYFKGAPGRTEYPEDLHGIRLAINGDSPQEVLFDYSGATLHSSNATEVAASIPQTRTRIALESAQPAAAGSIMAGHLFSPFFTLTLTHRLTGEGTVETCLKIIPIND
jgi:hypothetical protein